MNRILVPVAFAAILAGCSAQQQSDVNNALQSVQTACTTANAVMGGVPAALIAGNASADVSSKVASLMQYAQSVCSSEGTIAAAVAKDTSGSTASWVTTIAGGVVQALPAILALL